MKKNLQSVFTILALSLTTTGLVNAQNGDTEGCYAAEVILFEQGLTTNELPVAEDRSNPELAIGQPDASNAPGGFVSLGVGGSLTLSFDGVVFDLPGNDLKIYETSFSGDNCGFGDDESAIIEVSMDGTDFFSLGTICRDGEVDIALSGLEYITQIRISSDEEGTNTLDRYDVDGVEALNGCGSIPVEEGCFGGDVLSYNPGPKSNGQPITDPNRIDPNKALGAPQLDDTFNFVSLGYEGELVLGFDGGVALNGPGDDILVAETTFGNQSFDSYPESAEVLVSQNGTSFFSVGTMTTSEVATFDIDAAGQGFDYIVAIKIVDTTPDGSVSEDGFDVDGVEALNGCGPNPSDEDPICEGVWRTQTQGGWGAPANGNNNGVYRDANFDGAFPNGLTIGCAEGNTLSLTSAAAVQDFLPSGGQPSVLSENLVDPTGNEGSFAGNLTALALSVGFDDYDADFAPDSDFNLGDLVVLSGTFEGLTVYEVLALANDVIGGCNDANTPQQLNSIVDDINNSYTDGIASNNPVIGCADDIVPQLPGFTTAATQLSAFPNPAVGQVAIVFTPSTTDRATVEIFDMNGRSVATLFNQEVQKGEDYRIDFNGEGLPNGLYITKFISSSEVVTEKVMIAR
jgi:hypothetical protein